MHVVGTQDSALLRTKCSSDENMRKSDCSEALLIVMYNVLDHQCLPG